MAMGQHLTVVVALIQLFCNDCSPVHNCPATDLTNYCKSLLKAEETVTIYVHTPSEH